MQPDMLREALSLASRGFRVIPIHTPRPDGGCSCEPRPSGDRCGGSAGKHPRLKTWQKDATLDARVIREWWRMWPLANIGLVMGGPKRLVAVDVDGPEGRATIARLEADGGRLPPTLTSRSGRVDGGEHRFFHVPEGWDLRAIKNRAGKTGGPMPKVDIRTEGGQVVAPPSLHVSGNRYAWQDRNVSIAELPRWMYDLATWEPPVQAPPERSRVEPTVVERARAYLSRIAGAVSGQSGHAKTLLVAEHLVRGFELDDGTAMMLLREWNRTCDPPWSERELQHKVSEARRSGTAVRWGAHTNDSRSWQSAPRLVAPAIVRPQNPGDGAAQGFIGALLDAPPLFEREDVLEALSTIDGPLVIAIAATRCDSETEVLERMPAPLRSFAEARLREPVHQTVDEAARWFHHYLRTWRRVRRVTSPEAA